MAEPTMFICKGCGSPMTFDPKSQQLQCGSCGAVQAIRHDDDQPIREYPIEDAMRLASVDWQSPTVTVRCGGCGAESIVPAGSGTVECAYCGSQQILSTEGSANTIRPESLVPFRIGRDEATQKFKIWLKKAWLAPKIVRQAGVRPERFHGIYIPFWTYDSQTWSNYTAEIGTYYYTTETRTVRDNDGKTRTEQVQVRHTRWHTVSGSYEHWFDDVRVLAVNHTQSAIMDRLNDYDLSGLVPYTPEYIAGCEVNRYDVNVMQGFETAKDRMHDQLVSMIRSTLHGDEVRNVNVSTRHTDVRFKHILLPMWLSAFNFKSKIYHFVVNGQSGSVKGKYPLDPVKVTLLAILGLALIAGLIWLIAQNGGAG